MNFKTVLTADRHDGAYGYRTMHYDAKADAFLYDSTVLHPFAN